MERHLDAPAARFAPCGSPGLSQAVVRACAAPREAVRNAQLPLHGRRSRGINHLVRRPCGEKRNPVPLQSGAAVRSRARGDPPHVRDREPRPPAPDAHAGRALALGVRATSCCSRWCCPRCPRSGGRCTRASRRSPGCSPRTWSAPRSRRRCSAASATCSARRRCSLIVLVLLIVAGSLLAALTSSVAVMLIARVIQGAGGAIFPLAFSIVRDEFPRERVAGAIGMLSALIGVGAGVAIVIAGPDRRQPLDPLALLDPGGHDRRSRSPRRSSGCPSRRSPRRAASTRSRCDALGLARSRCCSASARAGSGAGRRRA